jgi:hypothetical protein
VPVPPVSGVTPRNHSIAQANASSVVEIKATMVNPLDQMIENAINEMQSTQE